MNFSLPHKSHLSNLALHSGLPEFAPGFGFEQSAGRPPLFRCTEFVRVGQLCRYSRVYKSHDFPKRVCLCELQFQWVWCLFLAAQPAERPFHESYSTGFYACQNPPKINGESRSQSQYQEANSTREQFQPNCPHPCLP